MTIAETPPEMQEVLLWHGSCWIIVWRENGAWWEQNGTLYAQCKPTDIWRSLPDPPQTGAT